MSAGFWRPLLVLVALQGLGLPTVGSQPAKIRWALIETGGEFPEAASPSALRLACAPSRSTLRNFFSEHGLPFQPELVRQAEREACHVFFQPSVAGFRADTSDRLVGELFFSVETIRFLTGTERRIGDVLDVAKQVLEAVPHPLDVSIGVQFPQLEKWYQRALENHFLNSRHRITLRKEPGERSFPWVQDYLKSGQAGGSRRILVPRRLFEDAPEFGAEFSPLLDAVTGERFQRSQLSWDGGDVQFVFHPLQPGRLLMLLGSSAKNYWGQFLSDDEYAYVMKLEFGADEVVWLPRLAGHVDYGAAFLPDGKTVLVSEIMAGSQELAQAAIRMLQERFPRAQPSEMMELARQLAIPAKEFHQRRRRLREAVVATKRSQTEWLADLDDRLVERLQLFIDDNCRENLQECFSLNAQELLLATDLPLLSEWISKVVEVSTDGVFPKAMLTVIESQLPGYRSPNAGPLDQLAARLAKLGFRVIRVPKIAGEPELDPSWSGISYANMLALDDLLLVPRFGFGPVEDRILEQLQQQIPAPFRVVPIYAQRVLLFNGGIHCVTGIGYSPEPARLHIP